MHPLENFDVLPKGFHFRDIYPPSFGPLAGKPHLGVDLIVPEGTSIVAPFDGVLASSQGNEGGNMAYFFTKGDVLRFLHCSVINPPGHYSEGAQIAISGNTGLSTGPHVHFDISVGQVHIDNINNFLDPETYDYGIDPVGKEDVTQEEFDTFKQTAATRVVDTINEDFCDSQLNDADKQFLMDHQGQGEYFAKDIVKTFRYDPQFLKRYQKITEVVVPPVTPSEYPKTVTTTGVANERQATDSTSALVSKHPKGYQFTTVAQVEGQIPFNCTSNKWYQTEHGTFIPVDATQ